MPVVIPPTVGRIVHYYTRTFGEDSFTGPLAAIVAGVVDQKTVNLTVNRATGGCYGKENVPLLQDGESETADMDCYCCWMQYQKGQAAKTAALEAKLKDAPTEFKNPDPIT